jgi:hypothetical protein
MNKALEDNSRQWFALGFDGNMYAIGDCGDYETADEIAVDMGIDVMWLADYETAKQWLDTIARKFEIEESSEELQQ